MKKQNLIIGIFIVLIILIIGIFFAQNFFNKKNNPAGLISAPKTNCVDLQRNYAIPETIFSSLPLPPKCFQSIVQEFNNGKFFDEQFFSQEFFLQPEFYPNFKEQGLKYWLSPDASRWNVIGFGFVPANKTLTLKEKTKITARFFVHSAFGIRTFQGMKIVPEFENKEDEQFVSVKIINDEFVLEPSYPKFEKNWATAVDVVIEKKKDFHKGIAVNLRILSPSAENQQKWQQEFGAKYFDATQFVGEKSFAKIIINQ